MFRYRNMSYCMVNFHKYRSLRKDLIDSLSNTKINALIKLLDSNLLKKSCKDKTLNDILPNSMESTWDLLDKRSNN